MQYMFRSVAATDRLALMTPAKLSSLETNGGAGGSVVG